MDTDVVVAVTGGDRVESTQSLISWLRREPELRGTIHTAERAPGAGEMGSLVDVATVAVGGGGAVSMLAMSLRTWLAQPRRSDVAIEIRHPDGRSVIIDAKRVDDVDGLLRTVLDTGK
ncbi:hypothetical protein NOVA_14440 [Nocardia nova]|uniref:effector-associated constant component EACC1 n=1 Tax=Nocardia nova TaxID=37330 RepID=UPI001C47B874|nr:hypothetical protein [Nocardia nova]MBV7703976.1 hypothetical protein [Nocardia nova]